MTSIFAKKALLERGWGDDVRLTVDDGLIASCKPGSRARDGDIAAGIVIPGLANAHSHAFQRALAGRTEYRGADDQDNFWSWRTRMYELAAHIDSNRLFAIARQLYSEMLESGYTAVAEFHYLHQESMLEAIANAAAESGIRLTYVPILYERSGFDAMEPNEYQRRFVLTIDEFAEHYEQAQTFANGNFNVAIGAHSLRAVSRASIKKIAGLAERDGCPMHIHIAEQTGEVDQCMQRHGQRPVELLLDEFSIDENWCLVHATHMTDEELDALVATGAVICLCPSTEGNLGDGIFRLQRWLSRGGRIAIGSDSHITVNPFEELRWLEYGQRLLTRTRNVAAIRRPQTGRSLFEQALEGGALACGNGDRQIGVGAAADLVTLDDQSPMLAGHGTDSILDALVFSGFTLPIDSVMVAGNWTVNHGRHRSADEARADYAQVVNELTLDSGASL